MKIGGETIGMLSTQSYQPNIYTQEDVQLLSTLANQAIVAIQNGRLFAETQRLAEELEQRVVERTAQLQHEQQNTETLLRILTEVSSSLDLDRALNRTLALLNDAIGAEQGTIMLLQSDDNMLHYRAGYGYLSRQAVDESRAVTLRVGEGLAGWVAENRQAVLIEDLHQDPRWVRSATGSREHRSCIVAPMMVGEDMIGVLLVFHRKVAHFNPELLNLVQAIGGQVAVSINNAHLYELIRDQAERLGSMLRNNRRGQPLASHPRSRGRRRPGHRREQQSHVRQPVFGTHPQLFSDRILGQSLDTSADCSARRPARGCRPSRAGPKTRPLTSRAIPTPNRSNWKTTASCWCTLRPSCCKTISSAQCPSSETSPTKSKWTA
jgi:FOG: GAF domain